MEDPAARRVQRLTACGRRDLVVRGGPYPVSLPPGPAFVRPRVVNSGQTPLPPLRLTHLSWLRLSAVKAYRVKPFLATRIFPTLVPRSFTVAPPPAATADGLADATLTSDNSNAAAA